MIDWEDVFWFGCGIIMSVSITIALIGALSL